MLISRWAGKPCSSSSQMWLTAAPGGVIGGDAVGVAVIWMWCRPPCECGRSSFPSASASTRRRRLMPLGRRVARNDHLGSQVITPTNSNLAVSKIISISTHLCALPSLPCAVYFFEKWRFFLGSGRTVTTGWTWEGGQSRHRQRRPRRRLVAVAAVGREGSKRSGAAAGVMVVVQRKRWIRMELGLLMMGAESPVGRR